MLSNDRHNIGNTSSTYNYGYGRNTSGIMDDDEYYLPDNWYNYSRNTSNILHSAGYNLRSCWNNIKNYGKNIYNIISEEDAYTQLRIANEHFSKNCVTLAPSMYTFFFLRIPRWIALVYYNYVEKFEFY